MISVLKTIPGHSVSFSPSVSIFTGIPGFVLFMYGLNKHPKYVYTCKSCGNVWKRSTKEGPEEGDPRYEDWVIYLLSSGSIAAAYWLGEHKSDKAIEALIRCLDHRNKDYEELRIAAIKALKKIGDERAMQSLYNAGKEEGKAYYWVRLEAIRALSIFEDVDIRNLLEKVSHDEDDRISKAAKEGLAKMNTKI
jgi:hypothetical protein